MPSAGWPRAGQDRAAARSVRRSRSRTAEVPVRILLHGKEGPVGLMPPVGSVLTDEQIAAVLTYIRREWGQAGSVVDAAVVKTVRDTTAARTRTWTHDELMALVGAPLSGRNLFFR